jgi:hypothetical protein
MNEKEMARILGLVRTVLGVGMLLMPKTSVRALIGQEAKPYPTNMFARGLGARDAAIGIGILAALENDAPVRGWLEASALSDIGDAIGTLSAWRDLPGLRRLLLLVTEVGVATLAMQLASALDD